MSGRDIAELTGKQHKYVKRDFILITEELMFDASKFGRIYTDVWRGRRQSEYLLPKNLCLTSDSECSALLPHKIITRLLKPPGSSGHPTRLAVVLQGNRQFGDQRAIR